MACNLGDQFGKVGAGSERGHAKFPRQRFHYGKALPANRTCGAENRKLLHEVSYFLLRIEESPSSVYDRGGQARIQSSQKNRTARMRASIRSIPPPRPGTEV